MTVDIEGPSTYNPTLLDEFFYLFGVHHDGKAGAAQIASYSSPGERLSFFNQDRQDDDLDIGQPEFLLQESKWGLDGFPKFI
jgi:hypothetical protein